MSCATSVRVVLAPERVRRGEAETHDALALVLSRPRERRPAERLAQDEHEGRGRERSALKLAHGARDDVQARAGRLGRDEEGSGRRPCGSQPRAWRARAERPCPTTRPTSAAASSSNISAMICSFIQQESKMQQRLTELQRGDEKGRGVLTAEPSPSRFRFRTLLPDDDGAREDVVRGAPFGVEERVEDAEADGREREHVDERAAHALARRRHERRAASTAWSEKSDIPRCARPARPSRW